MQTDQLTMEYQGETAQADQQNLECQLEALQAEKRAMEHQIETLQADKLALQNHLEALQTKHNQQKSENERCIDQLNTRLEELSTLNRIMQLIASMTELNEALNTVALTLGWLLHAHSCSISLVNEQDNDLIIAAEYIKNTKMRDNNVGKHLSLDNRWARHVVTVGRPVMIDKAPTSSLTEPIRELLHDWQTNCLLSVPLTTKKKLVGMINIGIADEELTFTDEEIHLAETIATQIAGVIEKSQLYHEMQREKRLSETLIATSPIAITMTDLNAKVVKWNPAAEQLFGYTETEALGQNIARMTGDTPPPEAQALQTNPTMSMMSNILIKAHKHLAHKNGTPIDAEVSSMPTIIDGGWVGSITIYYDITERLHMEAALRKSQALINGVIEHIPAALYVKDMQRRYVLINHYGLTNFDLERSQVIDKTEEEVLPPEIVYAWQTYDTKVIDSGTLITSEEVMSTAKGLGTYLLSKFPIFDEQGQITAIGTIATDISERKRTEEEIRRQKEYLEALMRNNPVAIISLDYDATTILSWNPAAEQLFGYTADEAMGQTLSDLILCERNEEDKPQKSTTLDEKHNNCHSTSRCYRKNGTPVDVERLEVPVSVDGNEVGYIVIYYDVTELLRARQQAEVANQAKSAFLATMSHEIRTPMNAIIGMSGLLLDTPLNAEQEEFTQTIRTSSNALLAIINDILDFSKIEAGKLELEIHPFDLRECLEDALDLVAPRVSNKQIELACLMDEHTPVAIMSDVTRLRQVLVNLLNNAVKFTEEGEVVITVHAERIPQELDECNHGEPADESQPAQFPCYMIHFNVRDTGIGIPQERMDRLFQSFSQVDASTTRRFGGTGLGLAISKRLVEMMGGTVHVESSGIPGQGTTFSFSIKAKEAPPSKSRARLHGVQPHLRGKRLLIVDDNETNRRILLLQAKSWGLDAYAAATPHEALEWLQRGDVFDIGILDMQMPEMDGAMLATAIRQIYDADKLPLIMLSSLGQRLPEEVQQQAQFAAHLTKPVKNSHLFNTLAEALASDSSTIVLHAHDKDELTTLFDETMASRLPLRILIVEDNTTNQRLALLTLERLGYRAECVSNGQEAIEILFQNQFDIALMDLQMPVLDGIEATRRIRQKFPPEKQPWIIAVTANAMKSDRERCIAAGMDDYISKPIDVSELIVALQQSGPAEKIVSQELSCCELELYTDALARTEQATPEAPAAPKVADDNKTEQQESLPILDMASLQRLCATMGDQADMFFPELLNDFLTEATQLQAEAQQALEQGKTIELCRAAHSLKSSSANFGATRLSDLCKRLEHQADAGDLTDAPMLLAHIAEAFEEARGALEHIQITALPEENIEASTHTSSNAQHNGISSESAFSATSVSTVPSTQEIDQTQSATESTENGQTIPDDADVCIEDIPILDTSALQCMWKMLGEIAEDLFPELVNDFLIEAAHLQDQAEQALAAGEVAEMHRAVEMLKASSINFGAARMAHLCQKLENHMQEHDVAEAATLLAYIAEAHEQVRPALQGVRIDDLFLPNNDVPSQPDRNSNGMPPEHETYVTNTASNQEDQADTQEISDELPIHANGADNAETSILDPVALRRLWVTLGDHAALFFPELLNDFLTEASQLQHDARQALEQGKPDEVRRAAHSLKSSSASFGASNLSELSRQLEHQAEEGHLTEAHTLLQHIAEAFEDARVALEQVPV